MSASEASTPAPADAAHALAAVLVLYKCNLEDSQSYRTLMQAAAFAGITVPLVIYDNSPNPQPPGDWLTPNVTYHHDPSNGGLVPAYNFALTACEAVKAQWLLLLDQDTSLPQNYLQLFFNTLPRADGNCAAFAPRVRIGGHVASPKRFLLTRPRRPYGDTDFGPAKSEIVAINSCLFVCVEHLRSRGGYPKHYRLDAVDFWFCADAYEAGNHLFVLDSTVDHVLSIRDMRSVSMERWHSITSSDADFTIEMRRSPIKRFMAVLEGLAYAGFLLLKGHPRHGRIMLKQTARIAKSIVS